MFRAFLVLPMILPLHYPVQNDNSQPKSNDRGQANAEGYHGEVLFDPPNPNDVTEQSDELESDGSGFLEATILDKSVAKEASL